MIAADAWLTISGAALAANVARGTLMAAILRAELPAACGRCHTKLSKLALKHGHLCRLAPTASSSVPMVIRRRDLAKFSVSPSHRTAGLKSAENRRTRAKKPKKSRKSA
jgi:hypothetical protein